MSLRTMDLIAPTRRFFCLTVAATNIHKLVLGLFMCLGLTSAFATGTIEMSEYLIPSNTAGISLYVRNKHLSGMKQFTPEKTVLYVHGSTYPSETAFDLSLAG